MRNRLLKSAWTLAAFLPALAMAQQPPVHREGSWEFSLGAGFLYLDASLRDFLGNGPAAVRFANTASPSRATPLAAARVGYNFNRHLGVSVSGGGAMGSGVTYLTPTAAVTYTVNLNAKTSPFVLIGTEFTRISGNNGRVTHSTWGAGAGLGVRHMVGENLALRLEGRMRFEGFDEIWNWPTPTEKRTTYSPVVTLGISYFTRGRQPPVEAMAPPPCPVCARARVDTVRIQAPPPPPPPPPVCSRGVPPPGSEVDRFGCLVLRDTLLLEGVHFDFDKSELSPSAKTILDRVAESMLAHAEAYFEIAGHTDSVGTFAYNFLLSARRAAAVRAYLITGGVPAYRMTAVGYGESLPIAPNATVEGRALNRRGVQVRVLKP